MHFYRGVEGYADLAVGNGQGLLETGFSLGSLRDGQAQQQRALEPIRLRERVAPPARLERCQRLPMQKSDAHPSLSESVDEMANPC